MERPGSIRPELYRWKRTTRKPISKPVFDYDNVEHWIKRVEQASEFAVSEVFSLKPSAQQAQRAKAAVLDLESTDQLFDHNDAYNEAQDLLSEWMSTKLRLEIASEEEDECEDIRAEPSPPQFVKYNRFDDLCNYLEQETESATAQDFLQQLLQKEVVDSGILADLRSDKDNKPTRKRDLRLTMELRHQQVKENRAKRQKEMEKQRQERALKKSALSQAQMLVQEEDKKKTLKAKKEEEEIQREMVKLRKEMLQRRKVLEEARKIERNRQEVENSVKLPERTRLWPDSPKPATDKEKMQKQARIQERLSQIYAENYKCLQKYFSAWYKLVLERRVKMGKARALADWKHQLWVFRAWRDYVWSRRLERETEKMELDLREQNRKQRLASESYRRRLLRHCFIEWQLWSRAHKERRELEERKEETKRKMAALLDAASSLGVPTETTEDQRKINMEKPTGHEQKIEEFTAVDNELKMPIGQDTNSPVQPPEIPRHAWQVTRKHATLTAEERAEHHLQSTNATDRIHSGTRQKIPGYGENFESRHKFQRQMIDEQRRQLQEQKEMILGLMENQRLIISKQECDKASTVTAELCKQAPPSRDTRNRGSDVGTKGTIAAKSKSAPSLSFVGSECRNLNLSPSPLTTARSPMSPSSHHPAVTAMEERAAQRAERKRQIEEMKRKREEEKLAQLKLEEEERLQKEAAEREAQLERKREEKRLQKQREQEKKMRLQRQQEHEELAQGHYNKSLLRYRGLEPWKKLMVQSRQNMQCADNYHSSVSQRRGLLGWCHAVRHIIAEKNSRADKLRNCMLIRRSFQQWVKYKDYLLILEERADRHYKAALRRKLFLAWLDLTQEAKIVLWEKQRLAAEHNQRRILLTAFRIWKQYPQYTKELKVREERRELLRKKVSEMLPDFRM
ncbi:coiled-coil domain-containing protein 191 [Bombina bombina]|uniref:coiled-coil domain-containing protein 191 n=1 Tax=Bombina bombina TaxID=8345 RepID=UPI00235A9EF3|nr:coiled-coil domain-containing protein 191 [Bombina bombina]